MIHGDDLDLIAEAIHDLFPVADPRLEETDKAPVEDDGAQPFDPFSVPL